MSLVQELLRHPLFPPHTHYTLLGFTNTFLLSSRASLEDAGPLHPLYHPLQSYAPSSAPPTVLCTLFSSPQSSAPSSAPPTVLCTLFSSPHNQSF